MNPSPLESNHNAGNDERTAKTVKASERRKVSVINHNAFDVPEKIVVQKGTSRKSRELQLHKQEDEELREMDARHLPDASGGSDEMIETEVRRKTDVPVLNLPAAVVHRDEVNDVVRKQLILQKLSLKNRLRAMPTLTGEAVSQESDVHNGHIAASGVAISSKPSASKLFMPTGRKYVISCDQNAVILAAESLPTRE